MRVMLTLWFSAAAAQFSTAPVEKPHCCDSLAIGALAASGPFWAPGNWRVFFTTLRQTRYFPPGPWLLITAAAAPVAAVLLPIFPESLVTTLVRDSR